MIFITNTKTWKFRPFFSLSLFKDMGIFLLFEFYMYFFASDRAFHMQQEYHHQDPQVFRNGSQFFPMKLHKRFLRVFLSVIGIFQLQAFSSPKGTDFLFSFLNILSNQISSLGEKFWFPSDVHCTKDSCVHRPGIEPGPPAWQASILPLNQRCHSCKRCMLMTFPNRKEIVQEKTCLIVWRKRKKKLWGCGNLPWIQIANLLPSPPNQPNDFFFLKPYSLPLFICIIITS